MGLISNLINHLFGPKIVVREKSGWPDPDIEGALNRGEYCPDCGSKSFYSGPRGGLAMNIMCVQCGTRWWYSPPFTPHRIDNSPSVYNTHAGPKTLREIRGDD